MKRELLTCGLAADGQLGLRCPADSNTLKVPEHVFGGPSDADGSTVVSVACGEKFSLFLASDGKVWSVGANEEGQLGRGNKGPGSFTIYPVNLSSGTKIIQIAAGRGHALAVAEDGRLFAWGSNEHGQLAAPANVIGHESPKRIADLTEVVQVACGPEQCIALCANGKVFTWGQQWDNANLHHPTEVIGLAGVPIIRVAAGGSHFLALTASGDVFSWGQNAYGQLGTGDLEPRKTPYSINMSSMHIVEIAAGYSHSVLLTQDGRLFVFGSDLLGQLGLSKKAEKQTMPVVVSELMGSHVSRVACGRCHTVAVVNGKLHSFGLNSSGQLANGMSRNQALPRVIDDLSEVAAVFAGWDQTFLIRSRSAQGMAAGPNCSMKTPTVITRMAIPELLRKNDKMELICLLESVFSSYSAINGSFLFEDERRFGVPGISSGIDVDAVKESFQALAVSNDCEQYAELIINSLEMSLFGGEDEIDLGNLCSVECCHIYLILPWFHQYLDHSTDKRLYLSMAHSLLRINSTCQNALKAWWSHLPACHFDRVVQGLLTGLKNGFHKGVFHGEYVPVARALQLLNSFNVTLKIIPIENFYLRGVENDVPVEETYLQFKLDPTYNKDRSWYAFPFLLNGAVKADILHGEAILQQQRSMNMGAIHIFGLMVRTEAPFYHISIRRKNIVNDTVNHLMQSNRDDLFKPLKVEFMGEEAEDGGGVKKEFFMLLFQQILSPEYGMFVEDPESHLIWFSGLAHAEFETFRLLGILSAMAVYNNVLVAFPFPLALYKMLLGQKTTIDDLSQLSPSLGKNLKFLLGEDGCEEDLALTFTIDVEEFGETKTVELKKGGAGIAVTQDNKKEYVELYVHHRLESGLDGVINKQFTAFADGFKLLIPDILLSLFQPKELLEMVVGNENYDWTELRKVVQYNGEYHATHPAIQAFWGAFFKLSEEEKKQFMQFLMGTTRLPVKGLSAVKITIHPCASHLFPAAHTCANQLDLPNLADEKEQLRRLHIAIQHTEGFTLV